MNKSKLLIVLLNSIQSCSLARGKIRGHSSSIIFNDLTRPSILNLLSRLFHLLTFAIMGKSTFKQSSGPSLCHSGEPDTRRERTEKLKMQPQSKEEEEE